MAYTSNEFKMQDAAGNSLSVAAAYATAYYNGNLFVIWNPDGSNSQNAGDCNFNQTVFNCATANIDQGDATKSGNWSTTPLAIGYALSDSNMAAVPCGGNLYLFWKQVNTGGVQNQLSAAVFNGSSWSNQQLRLQAQPQNQNTVSLWPPNGGPISVSATALGDDAILVACAPASLGGSSFSSNNQSLFIGCYYIEDINTTDNVWPARSQFFQSSSYFSGVSLNSVQIEWFPLISQTGQLPVWCLAVNTWDGNKPGTSYNFALAVTSNGIVAPQQLSPNTSKGPLALRCDPAGRLSFSTVTNWSQGTGIGTGVVSGATMPTLGNGFTLTPANNLTTSQRVGWVPALAYTLGQPTVTTTQAQYPCYQFLIYSGWDQNLYCQVARYGTIQQTTQISQIAPNNPPNTVPVTQKLVIQGIVDGPIPVPNENISQAGSNSPNGFGDIVYGSSQTSLKGHKTSTTFSVGLKSTGETSKGFGPAWDISFSQGSGSVTESTAETDIQRPWIASSDALSTPVIDPSGVLFCSSMMMEVV
jgi:hypothetical protein